MTREWNSDDDRAFREAIESNKTWDVYEQKRREDATDPEVAELRVQREQRRQRQRGKTEVP